LAFLGSEISQGMATAVVFDAMGQELSFLYQVALNFRAQRSFPCAAESQIKQNRGGQNDNHEGRHQFEKNSISHFLLTLVLSLRIS
jgi:hypothetical protein